MPSFTQRLKDLYEIGGKTAESVGLDRYPIYDESHRAVLNDKIIQHYWNEEIGHESPLMFVQSVRSHMNIIMPEYNELYATIGLEFDPLIDVDMTSTSENSATSEGVNKNTADAEVNANSEAKANSKAEGKGMNATYPQQQLQQAGQYATSGSESASVSESTQNSEDTQKTTSTAEGSNTNESSMSGMTTQKGRSRSAASLIQERRNLIVNVDQLIVLRCEELFMAIWSTSNAPYSNDGIGYNWPYLY